MVDAGYVSQAAAERAGREPMHTVRQALDTEAPYFVDLIGQTLTDQYPGLLTSTQPVDIYTTLDIGLQRIAQEAVHGRRRHDRRTARAKKRSRARRRWRSSPSIRAPARSSPSSAAGRTTSRSSTGR